MIRRFIYHGFWNLYDYLGTYFILGTVTGSLVLGTVSLTAVIASSLNSIGAKVAALAGGVVIFYGLAVLAMAGFFSLAARAAQDLPARWIHFKNGIRQLGLSYLKLAIFKTVGMSLISANVAFYLYFASTAATPVSRMIFVSLGMTFIWFAVLFTIYLMCAASTPSRFPDDHHFRSLLRRSFVLFILSPVYWAFVTLVTLFFAVLQAISIVGLFFLLPTIASLSATAYDIMLRHFEFLRVAREEIGQDQPVSRYKRRALELGEEWEARQPRRTFREILKPWEA